MKRFSFLAFILVFFGILVWSNIKSDTKHMTNKASFATLFQVAGNVTSSATRAMGNMLPIDDLDEKELGEEIKKKYRNYNFSYLENKRKYLNSLVNKINWSKNKKFEYEVFVEETYYANAYALPGGVIVVTEPLLSSVKSESELVAILAHEIGHIENSHCFNAVKFRMLADKVKVKELGQVVDFANNVLLRHSYSKTQENEADEYAFEFMKQTPYDIDAVYRAFDSLKKTNGHFATRGIIDDYFSSHPDLDYRIEKFKSKANTWKSLNNNETRYVGYGNLRDLVSYFDKDYGDEEKVSFVFANKAEAIKQ